VTKRVPSYDLKKNFVKPCKKFFIGTCCMNVYIAAVHNEDGLISQDGTVTFTHPGQRDPTSASGFFPFSCSGTGKYAIVTAISCNGCASIQSTSCMGTVTATG
jgi:hypothetical protein